jgi:hypothetical protein
VLLGLLGLLEGLSVTLDFPDERGCSSMLERCCMLSAAMFPRSDGLSKHSDDLGGSVGIQLCHIMLLRLRLTLGIAQVSSIRVSNGNRQDQAMSRLTVPHFQSWKPSDS